MILKITLIKFTNAGFDGRLVFHGPRFQKRGFIGYFHITEKMTFVYGRSLFPIAVWILMCTL